MSESEEEDFKCSESEDSDEIDDHFGESFDSEPETEIRFKDD